MIFCFILIDFCDYFGFCFMTLNRNAVSTCTRLVFEKFICAYLHQFVREIIRLLVNNLHEKRITWSQDERNFASTRTVFVIWTYVTRKMHSFSANPTRVIFSCILYNGYNMETHWKGTNSRWTPLESCHSLWLCFSWSTVILNMQIIITKFPWLVLRQICFIAKFPASV